VRWGLAVPVFDRAPITKLKPNDPRTGRFVEVLASWAEYIGGPGLADEYQPDFWPIKVKARSAAEHYAAGDYAAADREFLSLSNLVARHPRATPLIAKWKEIWKLSKDPDTSAGAIQRLRAATAEHQRRFGSPPRP
jgi:hypothetical protein